MPSRGLAMSIVGILVLWYAYARYRESKIWAFQNSVSVDSDKNGQSSNAAYAEEGYIRTGMYMPKELKEMLATSGVEKRPNSPYY
jgi:hypothetical protein